MKLFFEDQILDAKFRKQVIDEITAPENIERKREYLKRYEIYKDKTKKWVKKALLDEGLEPETVVQMVNRGSNVSICRKVVNKLARTYSGGVERQAEVDEVSNQIHEYARLLSFDEKMRKGDRYRELHKNCLFQIVPEMVSDITEAQRVFKPKMRVMAPWQYDVIEDSRDNEVMRVVILSDFVEQGGVMAASEYRAGVHDDTVLHGQTNNKDDLIADSPSDSGKGQKRLFVWWSDKYHFQTNENGEIVTIEGNEEGLNPIEILPFANNPDEQDGEFWAQGGDDLIDGSILVNKLLTDMFFIAFLQGFGQWVFKGKNISEKFKMGPNHAIILDYDPSNDDPAPDADIISSNPPLDAWMRMIEQYVALLLTTNNLSPSNVAMKLDANQFPSGIALLIEKSEATDDISDKQKSYKDIERKLWEVLRRWHNLYFDTGELSDDYSWLGRFPDEMDVAIKFNDIKPVVTEKEKLEMIKLRKELGLDSAIDLLKLDNPDLTDQEAEEKLKSIMEEKLENMARFAQNAIGGKGESNNEADQEAEEKPELEDGEDG